MLSALVEKASSLLDRRFLLAWWFPTFMAGAVALFLGVIPYGWTIAWQWWANQDGLIQTWLLLDALLLVTLVAYVLQAFTRPLVRCYEGYWPWWLRQWPQQVVEKRWQRWRKERAEAARSDLPRYITLQDRLYHGYPLQAERLLPTHLGNVLRAAEDYPVTAYGMDAVFWWPRLMPLLPEAVQRGIVDALTPLLALLNLATLIGLVAVSSSAYLWRNGVGSWQGSAGVLIGGLVLARLAYLGAVTQAREYGQRLRAAFDLYRFDLLKALHLPLPASPQQERVLWGRLAAWLYNQDRGAAHKLAYQHGKDEEKPAKGA